MSKIQVKNTNNGVVTSICGQADGVLEVCEWRGVPLPFENLEDLTEFGALIDVFHQECTLAQEDEEPEYYRSGKWGMFPVDKA